MLAARIRMHARASRRCARQEAQGAGAGSTLVCAQRSETRGTHLFHEPQDVLVMAEACERAEHGVVRAHIRGGHSPQQRQRCVGLSGAPSGAKGNILLDDEASRVEEDEVHEDLRHDGGHGELERGLGEEGEAGGARVEDEDRRRV